MGKSGGKGDNAKKVAGNAKKAAAAAEKAAVEDAKRAVVEDAKWAQGTKTNAKKEADAAKKADAARKKAEREEQLAAEEAGARAKPKVNPKAGSKNSTPARTPAKAPSRGLDLAQLDGAPTPNGTAAPALNASGIDDALDALTISTTAAAGDKVERHPERRFKAAYKAFEERRVPELEAEQPGLRRNQRIELARKEFEKHPDNPFNQASVRFDASKAEIAQLRTAMRDSVERRLGSP